MTIYLLQPVRLLGDNFFPTKDPRLSLPVKEFLALTVPTDHPVYRTSLTSAQVKKGSFVGLSIRKDFFAEGLVQGTVPQIITDSIPIARRLRMDRESAAHPLVSFVLTRRDLGSNIQWVLKNDPSFSTRLVCAWRIIDITRGGMGVEEYPAVGMEAPQ